MTSRHRGLPAPRRLVSILVIGLALITADCSGGEKGGGKDKDASSYASARTALERALEPPTDEWARLAVATFFADTSSIKTQQDADRLDSQIAEFDSTKTLSSTVCQQLKTVAGPATPGPEKERDPRIESVVRYVNALVGLRVATALLQAIFKTDPPERDRLLGILVIDEPSDPLRVKAGLDALKQVGLLTPAGDPVVERPVDERFFAVNVFPGELVRFRTKIDHFVVSLQTDIKPCFPAIRFN